MRQNKKILALICALSMLVSMFASLTMASAAGEDIELVIDQKDTTSATLTVKYVNFENGIANAGIELTGIPKDAEVTSVTSPLKSLALTDVVTDNLATEGKIAVPVIIGDNVKDTSGNNVIVAIGIKFAQLEDASTVGFGSLTSVSAWDPADENADEPLEWTLDGSTGGTLKANTDTLLVDPSATPTPTPEVPLDKPTTDPEATAVPAGPAEVEASGVDLEVNKIDDTTYAIIATYDATVFPNGIANAGIELTGIPKDAEVTAVSSPLKSLALTDVVTDNLATEGKIAVPVIIGDNVKDTTGKNEIVTLTVKLTEAPTNDIVVTIGDLTAVSAWDPDDEDADEPLEWTTDGSTGGTLAKVWTKIPAATAVTPDKELEDLVDPDIAKTAEADDTVKEVYVALDVKKANGEDAEYGADKDYVAYYDGVELTEGQLNNYLNGTFGDVSEAIKHISFKYNSGVQLKAQLVKVNADDTKEVIDSGDNSDNGDNGDDTNSYKLATLSASPTSKTYTVGDDVTIKFTYDTKDYAKNGKFTFAIAEDLADYITNSGIKAAYKDADGKDVSKVVITDGKEIDIADIAAKGTITLTFKAALKTSKAQDITLTYEGENEEGTTVKAANKDKDLTATSKVSIKNETTTTTSSGGSGSTSSGGGAIANGLVNTTTGALPGIGFSDLSDAEWARDAINALSLRNIVSGYPDGTFNPNGNITRAEYAQILINAIGHQGDSADTYFDDVPTDAWFYHNVAVASQLGIISGYGDGNFGPYDLITREQMALMTDKAAKVMSVSLAGASVGTFSDDADIADWSRDAVYELANAGIINGMGDGTFAPKANATRAQAATIIYNTFIK